MCQPCYQGGVVYHSKMKITISCGNMNPNTLCNISYIEAFNGISR